MFFAALKRHRKPDAKVHTTGNATADSERAALKFMVAPIIELLGRDISDKDCSNVAAHRPQMKPMQKPLSGAIGRQGDDNFFLNGQALTQQVLARASGRLFRCVGKGVQRPPSRQLGVGAAQPLGCGRLPRLHLRQEGVLAVEGARQLAQPYIGFRSLTAKRLGLLLLARSTFVPVGHLVSVPGVAR